MNWADGQGIPQADELFEIVYRYRFYLQDDNAYKNRLDYLATFCKVVMTVDSTPYGIFFPEERVLLLNGEKGKGRLTKNAEKANHRYYIDEQGRIYATECQNNGKVLHVTFFYYLESRVEFVQYNLLTKVINDVGVIQHFSPTKFSFTYGYVDYTYLTNGGGICYLQKKEVEENGDQVTISTLRTCLDLKDCGKSKIWKKLFETTQTLPRSEAYPEKKGGRKVKSTAKNFEEVVITLQKRILGDFYKFHV